MSKRLLAGLIGTVIALWPVTASAAPSNGPMVVAHRGGALLWPENTLPAFDKAVQMGVDILEFDMQMTADDKLVVTHDGTVNASFCSAKNVASLPVRSLTLAQLRTFDCGTRHRALYPTQQPVPGTGMPTPDELFARYKGTNALFYGEIKMPGKNEGDVDPIAFAKLVATKVKSEGLEDRFILQSADYRAIDAMHEAEPRIRTCLLSPWRYTVDVLEQARQHHASCVLLRLEDADAAKVSQLQAAGIMVISQVIDDEKSWSAYAARGDDALFTNDPKGLIAFLKRQDARR
jgi:glycerophosphoryl diester phosphodiesterase